MGMFKIPVSWPEHPDLVIADRRRYDEHVDYIKKSMIEHGIFHNTGVVVLMWKEDLVAKNIELSTYNFDTSSQRPPVPMYTIAGDHTATAAAGLHRTYPKNKKWFKISASVVVASRTEHDQAMAKLYGGLDNRIRSTQRKKTVWDHVVEMHDYFEVLEKINDDEMKKSKMASFMSDLKVRSEFPDASIGSFKQVAKKKGQLWENIKKIFEGKTDDKKAPVPKNTTHFNAMSGIPEDNLVRWSDRVVTGIWKTKDFKDRCDLYKKELLLQTKMLDFTKDKMTEDESGEGEIETYQQLIERWPFFGDQQWFKKCVAFMQSGKAKDDLSAHIKQEILDKMRRWREHQASNVVYYVLAC